MIKLSHSGKNKYQTCPKSYELRYIDKLVPKVKGSPLLFGTAIDNALNFMLENKDEKDVVDKSMWVFYENWKKQKDNKYDIVDLPQNEDISYLKSDFDPLLLTEEQLGCLPDDILELRNQVDGLKKDIGWENIDLKDRQMYNWSSWFSLLEKAKLFIQAYKDQILPQIKEVLGVQIELKLISPDGNEMTGFIDAIIRLHDGRVAVLDNKTSSMVYTADSVANSEQLALYMSILNIHAADPNHSWKTPVDCCAYAVLSKKLQKTTHKTCQSCGHKSTERHAKCDNKIGKKRCNGEWSLRYEFNVPTQFLVDNVPEMLQDQVLTNAENVIEHIENKNFPHNFDACQGVYGRCEFFLLCHEGLMDGLIDIKDKKRDG